MTEHTTATVELVEQPDNVARWWRRGANALTVGRTALAGLVCLNTVAGIEAMPEIIERFHIHGMDYGSFTLAGAFAVFGAMDKLDGWAARRAEKRGLPPTYADMKRDPFHDKLYAYMAMSTAAVMVTAEGLLTHDHSKVATGGGIIANMAAIAVRDIKMTRSRDHAVDGVKPAAIGINKWKTGVQNVAHTIAVSPLPAWLSWPAYTGVTGMAYLGYKIADRVYKGEEYPGIREASRRVFRREELQLAA